MCGRKSEPPERLSIKLIYTKAKFFLNKARVAFIGCITGIRGLDDWRGFAHVELKELLFLIWEMEHHWPLL